MTTAQFSMIAPPPSVAAVLGALTEQTRIGQVDFSSRLAPEGEGDARDTDHHDVDPGYDQDDMGDQDDMDDMDDAPADELDEEVDEVEEVDEEVEEDRAVARPALVSVPSRSEATPAPKAATHVTTLQGPQGPHGPHGLAAATPTRRPAPRPERPAAPIRRSEVEPTDRVADRGPSIEEIARSVVERMHDAELAMMRHLESLEVEAERRAELATAQAELDAELIRLNARREAHAIVAAARERAQQDGDRDLEADLALGRVSESLTRFADVMDELRPSARSERAT